MNGPRGLGLELEYCFRCEREIEKERERARED